MYKTITVNDETLKKMKNFYQEKLVAKKIPYVLFQAKDEDVTITAYESKKVLFQGKNAEIEAKMWDTFKQDDLYYTSSIGSDEVGTGDYFGPIVVTACFVLKNDIKELEKLGVNDSKKITDEKILKIAPHLLKKLIYSSLIVTNEEYNKNYSKNFNLNKMKAILHNKVLVDITKKVKDYDFIIVDKFAKESNYFKYLKETKTIVKDITFLEKAENKHLSVAASSIISRYIFLKEIKKLSDKLKINLPLGAGNKVDKTAKMLIDKYGEDILKSIAKYNFKNTKKIKVL
ncbi:MAG TPA: ribonuclease HIII [Tenericutes bacterium]|jgi:ribonuclease HIII|nr:ribonuclease HIII [Mycoplasmatota bacterium]